MNISYKHAIELINEADVLLFKSGGFPGVGWWISKYTHSPYSHVALAHWENNSINCLEFREFKKSRSYPLHKYVDKGYEIDVFRCADNIVYPKLFCTDKNIHVGHEYHNFNIEVASDITNMALELIGKKYSYWTVWQNLKTYIPIVRLRTKVKQQKEPDPRKFVCSTLITYAFRKHFIDPVPFLSDEYTSPGDLARSSIFSYFFSIQT